MRQKLVGKSFYFLIINERSRYNGSELKGSEYLSQKDDLNYVLKKKNIVQDVYTKGKKIFFKIQLITSNQILLLFSFLSLHGTWRFFEPIYTKLTLTFRNEGSRLIEHLFFNDRSNFGTFQIIKTDEELKHVLKDTGPDYLNDNITINDFISKIKSPRLCNKEIGSFLMEQKYFSGIGAYINSECLYLSKISPFRSLKDLEDSEIITLFNNILYVIKTSYSQGGHSFVDYADPLDIEGTFETLVHEHTIDSNGYNIIKGKMSNKRNVFWVPEIQK